MLDINSLYILVQGYAKGLKQYELKMIPYRKITKEFSLLMPLCKNIEYIDNQINEICKITQQAVDNDDYFNLAESIEIEAKYLEELLDINPMIELSSISDSQNNEIEKILEDIDNLQEGIWSHIRDIGYELYNYLIGAEF